MMNIHCKYYQAEVYGGQQHNAQSICTRLTTAHPIAWYECLFCKYNTAVDNTERIESLNKQETYKKGLKKKNKKKNEQRKKRKKSKEKQ